MRFDFRMALCSIAIGMIAPPLATNPIARTSRPRTGDPTGRGSLLKICAPAGESGWDFSSRWLADGKDLSTIRTTAIAPVDLNTLMMHLEETLAKAYQLKGDLEEAQRYRALAETGAPR